MNTISVFQSDTTDFFPARGEARAQNRHWHERWFPQRVHSFVIIEPDEREPLREGQLDKILQQNTELKDKIIFL